MQVDLGGKTYVKTEDRDFNGKPFVSLVLDTSETSPSQVVATAASCVGTFKFSFSSMEEGLAANQEFRALTLAAWEVKTKLSKSLRGRLMANEAGH